MTHGDISQARGCKLWRVARLPCDGTQRANHRHDSSADCIMIGNIKVVFTSCRGIWEHEGRGEAGVEALHPSATCRSARVIHGSHFVSKSHHKSSLPWKGGWHSLCLEREFLRCVSEIRERETEVERDHTLPHTECFFPLLDSPAAVSLQSVNNSELEDRRRPCSLYLSRCLLP